jgi:hypothetical protein
LCEGVAQISCQVSNVFCGAGGGVHPPSSARVGTLSKVGTHKFHKTRQIQVSRAAATCSKVCFCPSRRWRGDVARKIRNVTSLVVAGRWLYVAVRFPIIQQRMEVLQPHQQLNSVPLREATKTQFQLHGTSTARVSKLRTSPHSYVNS